MVVALAAIVAVSIRSTNRTHVRAALPNPNGYDDLLKAATLVVGDIGKAATLNVEDLQSLVETNAESLRLVRVGLGRQCSVPTAFAATNFSALMGDLPR